MRERPSVLLADDDDHLAALVVHALDADVDLVHGSLHEAEALLRDRPWDAVVCAMERPDWTRLHLLPETPAPVVVLIREAPPDAALTAIRHGATDALCGDDLCVRSIRRAVLVAVARGHALAAVRADAHAQRLVAVGLVASAVGQALRPAVEHLSRAVRQPEEAPEAGRSALDTLEALLEDLGRADLS